jgi:hypothetical protein
MNPVWWHAAVGAASLLVAALWPLSPALAPHDALQARVYCAGLTVVVCTIAWLTRGARPAVWMTIAGLSAVAAVGALLAMFNANATCVADYNNSQVIIGRDYLPDSADYVKRNRSSASDLLLDAGGVPSRVWTPESIRSCRFWLGWGGLSSIPLFAACVSVLIARPRFRFARPSAKVAAPRRPGDAAAPAYDVFISYRHAEPDRTHAQLLLEALESRGLTVAIDVRDFAPNENFLSEMERCIKESRFVLCVVTTSYLDSDHTSEEAIICKTLDMADRRKRLVPLIFERVELPVWLHGLVGIDFGELAGVDPVERLVGLLKK